MPIYEYECTNCNFIFEKIQKISEPPITNCPQCAEESVKKLISATQFRLKGSGWYETDFKSNNEKKRNLASSDDVATINTSTSATNNKTTEA